MSSSSSQSKDNREVNNLLHTLRGEQYRHLQNIKKSRTYPSSVARSHNPLTSLLGLTYSDHDAVANETQLPSSSPAPTPSYSGPAPPKSWRIPPKSDLHGSSNWRAQALEVIASRLDDFTNLSRVPSLALLCVKMIISEITNNMEFREEVLPYIPPHLRRDIIRHCAMHSPLPNWKLYALFNEQGHADGEILIMGPEGTLQDHHLLKASPSFEGSQNCGPVRGSSAKDWDNEEELSEQPLHTLILVSTRLSMASLTAFPPSITYLGLINLSTSVPVHRLVKLCPLIVVLDLSYNYWLNDAIGKVTYALERIQWSRWNHLEILGLRDCYVSNALLKSINKSRWDDVEVIR